MITQTNCLHVIIPMAGEGSRFVKYGFKTTKFLLPINTDGETMIKHAVRTLNAPENTTYTFITRRHLISNELKESLSCFKNNWIILDKLTEGPAVTALYGLPENENIPIIVVNSDQIFDNWNCSKFISKCVNYDGAVLTYTPKYILKIGDKDKHSFVKTEKDGRCIKFSEKIIISNQALIGLHYFKNKKIFIDAYNKLLYTNERAPNGEFYISLMYNKIIENGGNVIAIDIDKDETFYPVGEPDDYFKYLKKKYNNIDNIIYNENRNLI